MNPQILLRPYNAERDESAVIRVWNECGWMNAAKGPKELEAFRLWLKCGTADVAELQGEAECLVTTHKGSILMLNEEIPFRGITSVTAGRPLRRMGAAGSLTARAIARAAAEGDAVAGLGIFDQGFYDRFGFGSFSYVRHIHFDPLSLKVPALRRSPVRLGIEDLSRMAANTAERMAHHGLVKFLDTDFLNLILAEHDNGFGLGFEDSGGKLSHHFWATTKGESGPYRILWMIYRDYDGLIELLSLIKSLGDQVQGFVIREPWGLQFQDLLNRPLRTRKLTAGSLFENRIEASSFKQARILNMEQTLSALKLPGCNISFNLDLHDPVTAHLPEDAPWKGLTGSWTVELKENGSGAVRGHRAGLPLMTSSVNAFTRLVFGVATPSGLAATDKLEAPASLLTNLDRMLRIPEPDMVQIF